MNIQERITLIRTKIHSLKIRLQFRHFRPTNHFSLIKVLNFSPIILLMKLKMQDVIINLKSSHIVILKQTKQAHNLVMEIKVSKHLRIKTHQKIVEANINTITLKKHLSYQRVTFLYRINRIRIIEKMSKINNMLKKYSWVIRSTTSWWVDRCKQIWIWKWKMVSLWIILAISNRELEVKTNFKIIITKCITIKVWNPKMLGTIQGSQTLTIGNLIKFKKLKYKTNKPAKSRHTRTLSASH